jgi:hypothetical protein
MNVFLRNMYYNVIPEKYDSKLANEERARITTERGIALASQYDKLVEEGYEDLYKKRLKLPLRSSLTNNDSNRNRISRETKTYENMGFLDKIEVLKDIKRFVEAEYKSFEEKGFVKDSIKASKKSLASNGANERISKRITLLEDESVSSALKWEAMLTYVEKRMDNSKIQLDKQIAEMEVKSYKNKKKTKTTRTKKSNAETQAEIEAKRKKAELDAKVLSFLV